MNLTDCKALVTGGASGMGRHFTLSLAAAGADVAFCDLDDNGIAETEAAEQTFPERWWASRPTSLKKKRSSSWSRTPLRHSAA